MMRKLLNQIRATQDLDKSSLGFCSERSLLQIVVYKYVLTTLWQVLGSQNMFPIPFTEPRGILNRKQLEALRLLEKIYPNITTKYCSVLYQTLPVNTQSFSITSSSCLPPSQLWCISR